MDNYLSIPHKGVYVRVSTLNGDKWVDKEYSGGYPYLTDFKRSYNFGTIEKANDYMNHFKSGYGMDNYIIEVVNEIRLYS